MNKQNVDNNKPTPHLRTFLSSGQKITRAEKREQKRKLKMKVSGGSVKKLGDIIKRKSKK